MENYHTNENLYFQSIKNKKYVVYYTSYLLNWRAIMYYVLLLKRELIIYWDLYLYFLIIISLVLYY